MNSEVREIRELARRYTAEQIEGCLTQQVETGENVCIRSPSADEVINSLAKADFVRLQVERGMSLADALRELARRIRQFQRTGR